MTKPVNRRILSAEQIEAHQATARAKNPNRQQIDDLRAQISTLSAEISRLTSDEEKYLNILMFLSRDFDSRESAVKVMTEQELGDHLLNLLYPVLDGQIDEAIMYEALERLGWVSEPDDTETTT